MGKLCKTSGSKTQWINQGDFLLLFDPSRHFFKLQPFGWWNMWHFRHSKNLRYGSNCTQCIVDSVFNFTGVILEIPHCTNCLANYMWKSTGVWYLSSTCQSEMHHSFVFREGLCAKIMSGHNAPPGAYIAAESIWRRDWVCSQAPLVAECQFSGKVRNEFLSVLAIIPRSPHWYFSWQTFAWAWFGCGKNVGLWSHALHIAGDTLPISSFLVVNKLSEIPLHLLFILY